MMKTVLMLLVVIWVPATVMPGMCHFTPQVTAQVGQNVTLQCCFDASLNLRTRTVDWKKDDKQVVHVYRDRKDCPDLQETQFRHRTALRHEDLSRGVMTLQILAQLSDTGNFSCNVPKGRGSEMLSQRVMLIVMNTREVHANTTRSPKEDEMTTSEGKNTGVIAFAWVCLGLFGAGLFGAGLGVLVEWRKIRTRSFGESSETPALEDANICQMETLMNPNDLGHTEQQVT
ncbi:uncharacterized protein LOC114841798 isoform X2 [Betta splendens]|uniref:Uncharacterized protein LOC114841798 isoform X2 n=1 Tax=Betta splendens TaxID=158456 RepID=A0A6P7KJD4_BETSP|nr:uncharacterized protein LOC114841798 isoform X2 [Betta splendens]